MSVRTAHRSAALLVLVTAPSLSPVPLQTRLARLKASLSAWSGSKRWRSRITRNSQRAPTGACTRASPTRTCGGTKPG
jgi:hypothetical protein